jgi:phospholipase/carboxylesterase
MNMNRIQSLLEDQASAHAKPAVASARTGSAVSQLATRCAYFAPLHYESNYAYPLLVWLPGASDDERQLSRIMPHVSMRNFVAVAPRRTRCSARSASSQKLAGSESVEVLQVAERQVFEAIELAQRRFHVAPQRIFVAGMAEGGSAALRVGLMHPQRFAGAASLGGPFPDGDRPLRLLDEARSLPLLLATGRASQRYDETRVCHDLRLLHTAGMSVTLRQYACGDHLTTQMLADLNRWMMGVICPS